MTKRVGTFVGMVILTVAALALALWVTTGGLGRSGSEQSQAVRVMPPAPISVRRIEPQRIEITDSYSGMVRPLERFSLGFEIAGRVAALGVNAAGESLDDGDRVAAGDELARLDDLVFRSRVEEAQAKLANAKAQCDQASAALTEAKAQLEKAQSDLSRSKSLRSRRDGTITEGDYQAAVTEAAVAAAKLKSAEAKVASADAQVAIAEAQLPIAKKNLADTRLVSPVDGVISRRLVNAGESINPQQVLIEIIQIDDVLLVVGVPEAYVGEIRLDQPVHVELLARDRFHNQRPQTEGHVYCVAQAADRTTGLFEVEILLPNPDGVWKPGLIALAKIVLSEIEGFRIPIRCVLLRDDKALLFTAAKQGQPIWEAGQQGTADCLELDGWIEQGTDLIVPTLPPEHRAIVARGQHRLVKGREVTVVDRDEDDRQLGAPEPTPRIVGVGEPDAGAKN